MTFWFCFAILASACNIEAVLDALGTGGCCGGCGCDSCWYCGKGWIWPLRDCGCVGGDPVGVVDCTSTNNATKIDHQLQTNFFQGVLVTTREYAQEGYKSLLWTRAWDMGLEAIFCLMSAKTSGGNVELRSQIATSFSILS